MELRLQQILEAADLCCKAVYVQDADAVLTGAGLYDGVGAEVLRQDVLYVCTAEEFGRGAPRTLHYLVTGSPATAGDFSPALSVTVLKENRDSAAVLTAVWAVFARYQRWESDVLTAILEGRPLQETMNLCVIMLKNPFALFDLQQNMLLQAGVVPGATENNQLWSFVLEHGYSPNESEYDLELNRRISAERRPFYFKPDNEYGQARRLIASIRLQDAPFGIIASVENAAPYTPGEYWNFAMVQRYIQFAIENSEDFRFADSGTPWFAAQLLRGRTVNGAVLQYNLNRMGRRDQERYFLLTFQGSQDESVQDLLPEFSYVFRDSLEFCYARQLIVLDYHLEEYRRPELGAKLKNLMQQHRLRGGASMIFHEFMDLHAAFMQSQACLAVSDDPGILTYFEDDYPRYINRALSEANESDGLFYPGLQALMTENREYGPELIECLKVYILRGRNLSAAAKSLFLHRHTVQYRIQKIEDFLKIDLSTLSDKELILLLISCERLAG